MSNIVGYIVVTPEGKALSAVAGSPWYAPKRTSLRLYKTIGAAKG